VRHRLSESDEYYRQYAISENQDVSVKRQSAAKLRIDVGRTMPRVMAIQFRMS